jgi:phosphoribosylglycinamide formyltransferase-1
MKIHHAVVLASGRGSNFKAIIEASQTGILPHLRVSALVCNNPKAGAIHVAKENHVPYHVLESKPNRMEFDKKLLNLLIHLNPDWILLAGFMLILKHEVLHVFSNRIINIHPSLLPKFRGLSAQKQALEAQEKETGCSVHFVTEELDAGRIILQKKLDILPNETEESLIARLLPIEHQAYIEALNLITRPEILKDNPHNHE